MSNALAPTLNTVWRQTKHCSTLPTPMPERPFLTVVEELRQTAGQLSKSTESNHRHELLRRMRLLLWEADLRVLDTEPPATHS